MNKLTIIILVIVLILIILFFPKSSGSGSSRIGSENTICSCFGFERNTADFGPSKSTCYGIPYSCKTFIME